MLYRILKYATSINVELRPMVEQLPPVQQVTVSVEPTGCSRIASNGRRQARKDGGCLDISRDVDVDLQDIHARLSETGDDDAFDVTIMRTSVGDLTKVGR